MPRGDGTGPNGMGPRTGRGLGYCNGYNSPGFTRGGFGGYPRGFGRGYGYGRGYRWGYGYNYPAPQDYTPVSEKTLLENEIRVLNDQLNALQKRLDEIDKKGAE